LAKACHDGIGEVVEGQAGPGGESGQQTGNAYVEGFAPALHNAVGVKGENLTRAEDQFLVLQEGRGRLRGAQRRRQRPVEQGSLAVGGN
jgi:hypothetical protein